MELKLKKYLFLLLSGVLLYSCGNNDFNNDNEITIPVSVEDVKLKPIEEFVDATGTVYASMDATLRAEISGKYHLKINPITSKLYKLGDKVKKGEVIIHIEDAEYENNIRIDYQKLQLEQKKSTFEKQKSLYDKGGVTQTELKSAELDFINQEYSYKAAQIELNKMKVVAPFEGVIVSLPYFTDGTKISANTALVGIMNYSKLFLEINLPEKQLNVLKLNTVARIMNYSLPDDTLKGLVTQISPAIDEGTRTFKAVLQIDNPKWKLRPGMFVKAELVTASKDKAVVIAKNIILSRKRGKTVFVVVKGASEERVITTGLENPESIEVINGLEVNDRLVTKGFETLRNRQKVKIIK